MQYTHLQSSDFAFETTDSPGVPQAVRKRDDTLVERVVSIMALHQHRDRRRYSKRVCVKRQIYSSPGDSEKGLIAYICETAATIRQKFGIFEHPLQSVLCLCWHGIEVRGSTFEHLL
jgi:hypothetical protein